jgi:membrane protease YdiL (CAAX protease family)
LASFGERGTTVTILAAAGAAVLVLLTGSLPWGPLITLNLRAGITMPWAVVPMAIYLGAYWMVVSGRWAGGPANGAPRRRHLRANSLAWSLWCASIAAGLLGFGAILALLSLMARLVALPGAMPITTPAGMPLLTAFALLTMQSVVAGVTEEAAFRGYMQSMVARRCGIGLAILAQGTLFGLLHAPNHPGAVLLMLPYYVVVSAVYGGLTWAADSILPAIVLHAAGDVVVLTRWWLTGTPEWQIGPAAPVLVRQSGVDGTFVTTVIAFVVLVAATTVSYFAVRTRRLREAAGPSETSSVDETR